MGDDVQSFGLDLDLENLFAEVDSLLHQKRPLGEMRTMQNDVADELTLQEYQDYAEFKEYCLQELGELNKTPGCNGALYSAIERGFILGYWFAMKKFKA